MLTAYRTQLSQGSLTPDPGQAATAERLEALAARLEGRGMGWLRKLLLSFGQSSPSQTARGLYIWGDVGRGKSMLMDMFFERAQAEPKMRAHFNAFMVDVHARIHAARRQGAADPIAAVAKAIAAEARLLCFDEFQVTDVTDAMILGRLFEQLFASGTAIVATSNVAPDRLYEGGLNRQLFLPFIAKIKTQMEVVELKGATDYRLQRIRGLKVYLTPLSEEADAAMDLAWTRLIQGERPKSLELAFLGRRLKVKQAARGAARFDFADLCEKPLAAADYLEIARHFHTVLIDHIPVMGEDRRDAPRRFVVLIDTLYDEGVKLICSAAAAPAALYTGLHGAEAFRRTASRLAQMQSEDYLKRGHGVHDAD